MPTDETAHSLSLETGQVWKVEDGYISILQVNQRTAHYKLLRVPDQKSALTRLINIDALLRYLLQNQATLLATAPELDHAKSPSRQDQ